MNTIARLAAASAAICATALAVAAPVAADVPSESEVPDSDTVVFDVDEGAIVVLADGRVFRSLAIDDDLAAMPAFEERGGPAAPPPPRPPSGYEVATLTDAGLQRLLSLASDAGLFEDDPDYGDGPTDQGYFDIVINAMDEHFEHHVYAPGFPTGDPTTQQRRDLLFGFVDLLRHIDDEFGDDITSFEHFVPDRWLVTLGGGYVTGSDVWPLEKPPIEGCMSLPSAEDSDTMTGVYRFDDNAGHEVAVVVEPVIAESMCD